jgi:leader peptidase (prepilin peptidase)/N-methyltransferase
VDLEHRIVPNEVVLPAAAVVLVARTALAPGVEWVAAALAAAAFLLVAALVYPVGLGMGDVKLALLLGAATGRWAIVALLVGFGAVFPFAVGTVLVRGRSGLKTAVPFVPFLALGGVAALLLRGG